MDIDLRENGGRKKAKITSGGKLHSIFYIMCWYLSSVTENQGFNMQCLTEAFKDLECSFTAIGFLYSLCL